MFPDLPKSFAPAMGTAVVRQDWGKKIGTNKLGSQIDTYKLPKDKTTTKTTLQGPPDSNGSCNRKKKSPSIMDGLTLYSVTGSFVDSLCTSTACVVSDSYTSSNSAYAR